MRKPQKSTGLTNGRCSGGCASSLKNTYGPVSDYCGPFQFKQPKRTSNLAGGGGPGTSTMVVAIEIYRMSFTSYHFGESSALSIVLLPGEFPCLPFST